MQWLALLILTASTLWAAPALSMKQQFQQPDGTQFTGRQQGDEHLHWVETEEGEIVLYNKKSKQFEYAAIEEENLVPSGERFQSDAKNAKTANGAKQASRLHPKINRSDLSELWQKKRQKAVQRRNKARLTK